MLFKYLPLKKTAFILGASIITGFYQCKNNNINSMNTSEGMLNCFNSYRNPKLYRKLNFSEEQLINIDKFDEETEQIHRHFSIY